MGLGFRISCRVRFSIRISFTVRVSVRVIQVAILSCNCEVTQTRRLLITNSVPGWYSMLAQELGGGTVFSTILAYVVNYFFLVVLTSSIEV